MQWWHEDLSLLPLIAGYALISVLFVWLLRRPAGATGQFDVAIVRTVQSIAREVWGLFVEDGAVAIAAVAVLLGITVFADHFTAQRGLAGLLLAVGVAGAVGVGLSSARRQARASKRVESSPPEPASDPALAERIADELSVG